MTTSDDTRQKLMDSMRKTKETPAAAAPVKKKRVTRKRAAAPAKKRAPAKPNASQGVRDDRRPLPPDSYQSGRRVWPD